VYVNFVGRLKGGFSQNTKAGLPKLDSNKGMLKLNHEPYLPLFESMKRINHAAYDLTRHFDNASH